MKLTYAQLEPHLTKKLFSSYIVSGEDIFLKQDAMYLIRKKAQQTGFNERIRLSSEGGLDENSLYNMLYASSLLAEKRLLELDFSAATPNKTTGKILQEYAEKPVADHVLLINIGKADAKITKSLWYQALEKISVIVTIWPISREQLPAFIIHRAKKYKMELSKDAAHLVAEYVEGNLIAAANVVEKIYLLKPETKLDRDLIKTILTDESRFTVFDFIENLIAGDTKRTLHILENLKQEGIEPAIVLWSITRELRLLSELALERKQGVNDETLFQKHRIFARRQSAIRRFLTRFSAEDCWQKLLHAAEIDKTIKGVTLNQVWDQLQLFCLRLAS